jgi:hypothetical protein
MMMMMLRISLEIKINQFPFACDNFQGEDQSVSLRIFVRNSLHQYRYGAQRSNTKYIGKWRTARTCKNILLPSEKWESPGFITSNYVMLK